MFSNRIKKCIILLTSIFALAVGVGCDDDAESDSKNINIKTPEEMKYLIESELSNGSNSDAIERFFREHNIGYSFDRFQSRYQAIIRDVSSLPFVDKSIVIYIEIDEQSRFSDYQVKESYVAP